MIALRVTPSINEEGANMEGAEEVGRAAASVWDRFGLSCALLRQTIAASMAHMTVKGGDSRKETKK